ncbi:MAG: OmpH family outer membrane protein [Sphingomonadales bacterium]|nr:OmpH family outer membrane protein [Sphingomonadales bacterium]
MTKLIKPILLAGLAFVAAPQLAFAQAAAPAAAPAGPVAPGVAIANLEAIVANSNAFKTAQSQRPVTYKAQYDQAEARRRQIGAQLQPLIDKFQRDRAAPNANQAALQTQAQTIQQIQDSGNQELQTILQPVGLSEAYVQEQINEKLVGAVQSAMTKQKITLLLNPQSVISANNAYNLNQAILNELNAILPAAQLVPPAGWEPREVREARAAQAAQAAPAAPAAGAAPAAPARPAPSGR